MNARMEKRERARTRTSVEDERGWAGQHGQRPATEEEKTYRGAQPTSGPVSRPPTKRHA